jgi:hypothetical protein
MQILKQNTYLGPKRRVWRRLGSLPTCSSIPVSVGPRWSSFGLRWPSLAVVGRRWPSFGLWGAKMGGLDVVGVKMGGWGVETRGWEPKHVVEGWWVHYREKT